MGGSKTNFKQLFNLKKRNRREPRANAFVLESLEPRLLLSATPMTAAVVTTDHVDYAPGETAVITTSNTNGDGLQFGAGEFVRFQVSRTDGMADAAGTTADVGPTGNKAWYVADGVGGFRTHLGSDVSGDGVADWIAPDNDLTVNSSISTTWFVEEQYRNSSLVVTAAGQESGAVASQAFTDANVNTSTVVTASLPPVHPPGYFQGFQYGDDVTFTATVTPSAGGTTSPVGTVEFFANGVSLGIDNSAGPGSGLDSVFSITLSAATLTHLGPDSYSIQAVFTGGDNSTDSFNGSTSGTINHTVAQKDINGFITVASKVYDGTTAAAETSRGLNGVLASDTGNVILSNGPDGPAAFQSAKADFNAAVYLMHAVLTGTDASKYHLQDANIGTTANIFWRNVTGSFAAVNKVYDGTTAATVQSGTLETAQPGTLTGVIAGDDVNLGGTATFDTADAGLGKTVTLTGATLIGAAAGNYTLTPLPNTTTTANITAKELTVNLTVDNKVYDGNTTTTGLVTTLGGVIAPDDVTLSGGIATFDTADAGTGKIVTLSGATLSGTGASNYSLASASTTTADITKASATVNVLGYTGTYDAAAHGASGTATGLGGVDLGAGLNLGTSFTNAPGGTANWTFSGGANYNDANGSVAIVITKADATVSVNGYTGVYDGAAHGASGTATGLGGVDLSGGLSLGASFTNAPGGTANWTFSGGTNYNDDSGNVAIVIDKASATVNVLGYTGTYDAAAHGASGTVTGVDALGAALGSSLTLGASFTNAPGGTANWTFSGGTNYNDDSGSVAIVINKANAVVTLTSYVGTYDGAAHQATGTATGVLGEDLSAGLNLSVTSHSNAGVYIDTVAFTDVTGNYKDTIKNVKSTINKANAVITLTSYVGTYDGAAHQATGTATGVLGEDLSAGLNLSVTSHSNAGVYIDTVAFTDVTGNYKDTIKNVKSTINKANAVITLTSYVGTYDGAAHQATGTATGVLGEDLSAGLNLSVTSHSNAGVYIDTVAFTDVTGNYKDTIKNVKSTINKANAAITVTGYSVTFDGLAHTATGTATGVLGEDLSAGLDLSSTTHTNVGSYLNVVTFTDGTGNYKFTVKNVSSRIL